jgi:hypothetical protein
MMAQQSEKQSNYELIDTDKSFISLADDVKPSGAIDRKPVLPSGQVIDGKNTLQSFDATSQTSATSLELIPPDELLQTQSNSGRKRSHPTLPTGEVIDGKNTLQSFDTGPTTVIAVAVEALPNIVDAELAPEYVSSVTDHANSGGNNNVAPVSWYKRKSTILILVCVVMVVITALGLYIGISESSSGSTNPTEQDPARSLTNSPVALQRNPSGSPTGSPLEAASMNPTTETVFVNSTMTFRSDVLTAFINNVTLTNQTIVSNGTSPESKALAWMILNDTTLDTNDLSGMDAMSTSTIGFNIRQRFPLLAMWFHQTETVKWVDTDGWLKASNECDWYGITCEAVYDESSNKTQWY